MNLALTIDADELNRAFSRAPVLVTAELQGWVTRTTFRTEREAKLQLRDSVSSATSGRTLNSIRGTIGVLKGHVEAHTDYAKYTITGRRPGKMPPFGEDSDIAAWSRRMGIDPFLVARAIGRKGTKGIPYMDRAHKAVKSEVDRDSSDVLDKIIRGLL